MLRLILASVCLTAARIFAAEESNSTTNDVFGTPPPTTIGERVIGGVPESASCATDCISIFNCPHLYNLYKKPIRSLTSSELTLLKESFCGWSIGVPYICCEKRTNRPTGGQPKGPKTPKINAVKPSTPPEISCGQSFKFQSYVTGGTNATLGRWPWMAALYSHSSTSGKTRFICGGSLIAKEWVLTAAHCVPDPGTQKLVHVRLGDLNLDDAVPDEAKPVEIPIKEVIKHAQYGTKPTRNDIALLRLSKPVEYTDHIRPICLHTDKKYLTKTFYDPKRPYIAGWGATKYLGGASVHLLEAEIDVVPRSTCAENYNRFIQNGQIQIDDKVICANALDKDTCQGDSGGPLMFREPGSSTWYQGGVVSVGYECGIEQFPGVYTKVAAFGSWIREQTGLKNL